MKDLIESLKNSTHPRAGELAREGEALLYLIESWELKAGKVLNSNDKVVSGVTIPAGTLKEGDRIKVTHSGPAATLEILAQSERCCGRCNGHNDECIADTGQWATPEEIEAERKVFEKQAAARIWKQDK